MFARVSVGSLVLHEAGGYIPLPLGPETGRYIAKIAAGGNQGNRTRNHQVLSEKLSCRRRSQGSPALEDRRNGTDRATERTVERNGTDLLTPFLGKRCRCATQTERTVFRKNFWTRI